MPVVRKQPQISKRHERKNFLIVNCVSNKFAESIKLYITLANDNTTRERTITKSTEKKSKRFLF
jgi:hypothetical protein